MFPCEVAKAPDKGQLPLKVPGGAGRVRARWNPFAFDRNAPGVQAYVKMKMAEAAGLVKHGWHLVFMHQVISGVTGRWGSHPHCSCLDPYDPDARVTDCEHPGKHPWYSGWPETATTHLYAIHGSLMGNTLVNFGIATGEVSDLIVLDVDRHGLVDGMDTLKEWESKHGALPPTVRVLTGGGGEHIYFRYPKGHRVPSRRVGAGIDMKADGGIVLADGSNHISGRWYCYDVDFHPDDVPVADAPEWLVAKITALPSEGVDVPGGHPVSVERFALPEVIEEGCRNEVMFKRACSLRARGFHENDIAVDLLAVNEERCRPRMKARELGRIAKYVAATYPAGTRDRVVVRANPVGDRVRQVTNLERRYLSDAPLELDARVTYVVSPMDTGKTTAIAKYIAAHENLRVLVLAHRITLARAWKGVLGNLGFTLYLDQKGGMLEQDRLILSLDSIFRTCDEYDLVVIDEIQQFIAHLDSATLGAVEGPLNHLASLLQSAKHVVVADADMNALTVDTVRRLLEWRAESGFDERLILNRFQPPGKVAWHTQFESLDAFRRERWLAGERLAISCTTRSNATRLGLALGDEKEGDLSARDIYNDMLAARPHAKVLLITNDTITDQAVMAFLHNPDEEAAKYDGLVYSPSMGTGVSVAIRNHFHHILGFCHAGTFTTASAALQGLARVRNPIDPEVHVWLGDYHAAETSREHFRRNLLMHRDRDRKIALKHLQKTPFGFYFGEAVDPNALEILADVRHHRAIEQDGFIDQVRARWEERGTLVRLVDPAQDDLVQTEREERSFLGEVIREAAAQAVVDAPCITVRKAMEVERNPEATRDMRRAAMKARIMDFFGIPGVDVMELTTDLVTDCTKHRLMDKVRRFADIVAIGDGHGEAVAKAVLASHERHGLKTRPGIDPLNTIIRLLSLYGIDSLRAIPECIPVPDDETLLLVETMNGDLRNALDIKVPETLRVKPFQLLSTVFRLLGVEGKTKRDFRREAGTDENGIYRKVESSVSCVPDNSPRQDWSCATSLARIAPTLGYTVDEASVDRMLTLSAARIRRWQPAQKMKVFCLKGDEASGSVTGFEEEFAGDDEFDGCEEVSSCGLL